MSRLEFSEEFSEEVQAKLVLRLRVVEEIEVVEFEVRDIGRRIVTGSSDLKL